MGPGAQEVRTFVPGHIVLRELHQLLVDEVQVCDRLLAGVCRLLKLLQVHMSFVRSFEWSTNSSSSASLIHSSAKLTFKLQMLSLGCRVLAVISPFLVECHVERFIIILPRVLKRQAVLLLLYSRMAMSRRRSSLRS